MLVFAFYILASNCMNFYLLTLADILINDV